MKTITSKEAKTLFENYGHHMHLTIPLSLPVDKRYLNNNGDEVKEEWETVLNNAMVYNPYGKKQYGMSSNKKNAENAMKFIKNRFKIYSSVFDFTTGEYMIED